MLYEAILTASLLLLLAFAIEHLGKSAGVPSIVLLIMVGLIGRQLLDSAHISLVGLEVAVPVIGTIGLILIVLEGAFDIELKRERARHIAIALIVATAGLVFCTGLIAYLAHQVLSLSPLQSLLVAVPISVISSAVAIPSSNFLDKSGKEFVVYESSISDILGILFFFTLIGSDGSAPSILKGLLGGGLLSVIFGAICAAGLMLALFRIDGHIRFIPLLAGLFALYAGGKLLGLSPLFMVLLFGLVINNLKLLTRFRWFKSIADDSYLETLQEFKTLTMELTFAVRGFFFILLGYWTDLSMLKTSQAWLSALTILCLIFGGRYLLLKLMRVEQSQMLTWIAPRGLITILLFINAKELVALPPYIEGAVLIVVLASALVIAAARWSYIKPE